MPSADVSRKLTDWFRQWRDPLRRFLLGRVGVAVADVEDVGQEVFLRLLRYEKAELVKRPQAYLFRIASNVAAEWSMRACNRSPHEVRELESLVDVEQPDAGGLDRSYSHRNHKAARPGESVMRFAGVIAVVCLLLAELACGAEHRELQRQYDLNIPAQSLESALQALSRQTGLQIARFSDAIDGSVPVGPVSGRKSAEDALKALLAPHGLTYKRVGERTIAVVDPREAGEVERAEASCRKPYPGPFG